MGRKSRERNYLTHQLIDNLEILKSAQVTYLCSFWVSGILRGIERYSEFFFANRRVGQWTDLRVTFLMFVPFAVRGRFTIDWTTVCCLVLVPICVRLLWSVGVRQGDSGPVQHSFHLPSPDEPGFAGQTCSRTPNADPRLSLQDFTDVAQVQRKGTQSFHGHMCMTSICEVIS